MDSCTALTEVFNFPKFTLGVSVYFQEGLPKAYSLILARNLYIMDSCTTLTEVFNFPKFTLGVSVYFQEGLPKAYSLILARNLYISDTQKSLQLLRNSSQDKNLSIDYVDEICLVTS